MVRQLIRNTLPLLGEIMELPRLPAATSTQLRMETFTRTRGAAGRRIATEIGIVFRSLLPVLMVRAVGGAAVTRMVAPSAAMAITLLQAAAGMTARRVPAVGAAAVEEEAGVVGAVASGAKRRNCAER